MDLNPPLQKGFYVQSLLTEMIFFPLMDLKPKANREMKQKLIATFRINEYLFFSLLRPSETLKASNISAWIFVSIIYHWCFLPDWCLDILVVLTFTLDTSKCWQPEPFSTAWKLGAVARGCVFSGNTSMLLRSQLLGLPDTRAGTLMPMNESAWKSATKTTD